MSLLTKSFNPLTDEDRALFNSYKDAINNKVRETFSFVPEDYDAQPISISRELGCGTFYTYKVNLPNNQLVEVAFHLGGKRATPLIGPPHFEITMSQ